LLDEPPLDTLLRTLALSLPPVPSSNPNSTAITFSDDASSSITGTGCVIALATALSDRTEKAQDVARNAQESFEGSAAAQLADARRAIQLLRDSVLAESPFGEVRLVDPEIEASIGVLGQEISKVREQVEGVDVSAAKGRSEKRTEILKRWG
jgi:hypothetical protein